MTLTTWLTNHNPECVCVRVCLCVRAYTWLWPVWCELKGTSSLVYIEPRVCIPTVNDWVTYSECLGFCFAESLARLHLRHKNNHTPVSSYLHSPAPQSLPQHTTEIKRKRRGRKFDQVDFCSRGFVFCSIDLCDKVLSIDESRGLYMSPQAGSTWHKTFIQAETLSLNGVHQVTC